MDSVVTPGVASGITPFDVDKAVFQYIALRNRKVMLEQQHKAQLVPFTEIMNELEAKLLSYMQKANVDHLAAPSGTAYRSTRLSATIKDGEAFRQFVIQQNQFQLVDWRANANQVFEYIRDHQGVTPPGLNTSAFVHVRFRSPTDKE